MILYSVSAAAPADYLGRAQTPRRPHSRLAATAASIIQRLSPEEREKLSCLARLTNAQRHLVALMDQAQAEYQAQVGCELAAREAIALHGAEFETFDAAGEEPQFAARKVSLGR